MRVLPGSGRRADAGARAISPAVSDARRRIAARAGINGRDERDVARPIHARRRRASRGARAFDADLRFLSRWSGPLGLLARAMLAYIFIVEGAEKIANYSGVAGYMQANGVDGRLLPLVILTELGGGLLVLVGLRRGGRRSRFSASAC